jgi:hypothetical protein
MLLREEVEESASKMVKINQGANLLGCSLLKNLSWLLILYTKFKSQHA